MRIFLDGYGSKIREISRCRPTVSNETILATKQKFLFTIVARVQSMTDIVLLGFWLILLHWMFFSSYTTVSFFVYNIYLIVYISVNTIFECSYLFFGWWKRPAIRYVCNWGNVGCSCKVVEKLVIRYVRIKWMAPNKCYGIFFAHWFGQVY